MPVKILFITLSNIGDIILSLPCLDSELAKYPQARVTVVVSRRGQEIFQNNPRVEKVIVFDKKSPLIEKIKLFFEFKKEKFDVVIDLRNSLYGRFLAAKEKLKPPKKSAVHKKDSYLSGLSALVPGQNNFFQPTEQDKACVENIFKSSNISPGEKIIAISAGARSQIKRWPKEKFVAVAVKLSQEFNARIILVGDKDDALINQYIGKEVPRAIDLSGRTSLNQLACLLEKSNLVITNDSAVLHLASYVNAGVTAVFGPTNEVKYGPWSKIWAIVKRDIFCRPCEKAQCQYGDLRCMNLVKVEDVLQPARKILYSQLPTSNSQPGYDFKRILIVRTDRIGDVILSTPVIKAMRQAYPNAYIAMMVSPYAKEIIDGNPYLDEVITYDKDGKHKSWLGSAKFSQRLKKKKFDLALVLHPTNRVHLITFFAQIKKRVGYNRKLGFLLTDQIEHTKQSGQKHEVEYNFDLVRRLGIEPQDKNLFIPIKEESEKWADALFMVENIKSADKLLGIHPAASCPSKIWPLERFARAADTLAQQYGFTTLLFAGPKDLKLAQHLAGLMTSRVINLAGKASISQLATLIKRCELFISNDSGPVHIASAVGTPVISIFGRNQPGLSPQRWGPRGANDRFLHKPVGCIQCLAHNCAKEFLCLQQIRVQDVLAAAETILSKDG